MAKKKKSTLGVGGIHRRVTKWEHGSVPENLLGLCRQYSGRVATVHALERRGRTGFKHVGLELEVDKDSPPPVEDFAGAILAMMAEHAKAHDVDHFRVDFFDSNMDKLDDLSLRVSPDGEADEIGDAMGFQGKFLLRLLGLAEKMVKESHERHMSTLDKVEGLTEQVALAMEALSGAVASAAESEMKNAEGAAGREEARYKHERDMKLLDLLLARVGFGGKGKNANPLAKLREEMPDETKAVVHEILGDDLWNDLNEACDEQDKEARAAKLMAVLSRLSPAQKDRLGEELPQEWQAKMTAAFEATLAQGGIG